MTTNTETATFTTTFERRPERRTNNGCDTGMGMVSRDDETGEWFGSLDGFGAQTWFTGPKPCATEAMTTVVRTAARRNHAEMVDGWEVR